MREVELSCDPDKLGNPGAALMAIKEAFREISKGDGAREAREVRRLTVDLSNLTAFDDAEATLACLVHAAHFAELATICLRHLELRTQQERFPVGVSIFGALPDLVELVITSSALADPGIRLPDFFQQVWTTNSVALYASKLTTLTLQGDFLFSPDPY